MKRVMARSRLARLDRSRNPGSYTGQYLKPVLARKGAKARRSAAE
jgi:hypothetical protein